MRRWQNAFKPLSTLFKKGRRRRKGNGGNREKGNKTSHLATIIFKAKTKIYIDILRKRNVEKEEKNDRK